MLPSQTKNVETFASRQEKDERDIAGDSARRPGGKGARTPLSVIPPILPGPTETQQALEAGPAWWGRRTEGGGGGGVAFSGSFASFACFACVKLEILMKRSLGHAWSSLAEASESSPPKRQHRGSSGGSDDGGRDILQMSSTNAAFKNLSRAEQRWGVCCARQGPPRGRVLRG